MNWLYVLFILADFTCLFILVLSVNIFSQSVQLNISFIPFCFLYIWDLRELGCVVLQSQSLNLFDIFVVNINTSISFTHIHYLITPKRKSKFNIICNQDFNIHFIFNTAVQYDVSGLTLQSFKLILKWYFNIPTSEECAKNLGLYSYVP